ncbi:hypothetical protein MPD5_0254 [Melissococcus plutonius DAT561]|nr:hypothetical protein MPD5_0254 [Melissococcus plutonius DAT561]
MTNNKKAGKMMKLLSNKTASEGEKTFKKELTTERTRD